MNQKNILRTLAPHLAAIGIFLMITMLYFSPMLEGMKLQQGDIMQYKGASHELTDYREAHNGEEALWTNSMFGGMPAYQISTLFHGNLLGVLDNIMGLGLPYPSSLLFMCFIGFYFLLIVLRVDPWLAITGGVAFGLSSYNLIVLAAGHNSQTHAIALFPLAIAGILLLFEERYLIGGILTAITISLQVHANHLQIGYYLFITILILVIAKSIQLIAQLNFKKLLIIGGILSCAGAFAVVSNFSLLWTTYEYGQSTIRGKSDLKSNTQSTGGLDKDYALQWSYGRVEMMNLLVPNMVGGASNSELGESSNTAEALKKNNIPEQSAQQFLTGAPTYWGPMPFTSGPVYIGAIMCFLFVFGFLISKGYVRWWLLSASILSILLAMGKNSPTLSDLLFFVKGTSLPHFFHVSLTDLFFSYFPAYNKFRTVYMILIMVQFAFPFLGIMGVMKVLDSKSEEHARLIKMLKISFGIVGGICALILLLGLSFVSFNGGDSDKQFPEWLVGAIKKDRASLMRMDALRSLVFVLLTAGAVFYFLKGKLKRHMFLGAFAVLVFLDMFLVGKRFLKSDDFIEESAYDSSFAPADADNRILADKSLDYRVFNLTTSTFQDAHTSYLHKSVGGYHAAKLRRYQELIEHHLQNNNIKVLNMLNTRWVIVKGGEQQPPVAQMNPGACGNAWFVDSVRWVKDADAEINALSKFEPRTTAVIDRQFKNEIKISPAHDSLNSISLKSYEPNHLVYEVNANSDGLIVFSEIYYKPGWNVSVDGKPADFVRSNFVLRAMEVKKGTKQIEFIFHPDSFYKGEKIAKASSGGLILLTIGVFGFLWWKRKKEKSDQPANKNG